MTQSGCATQKEAGNQQSLCPRSLANPGIHSHSHHVTSRSVHGKYSLHPSLCVEGGAGSLIVPLEGSKL